MIIQRHSEEQIRPDQVRVMASGLLHLARIDGITDSEKGLIESFLEEGKVDLDLDRLALIPFTIEGLLAGLDTSFLRKTFLRVAVALAVADGTVSNEEMGELRRLGQALGIDVPIEALVAEVEGKSLE